MKIKVSTQDLKEAIKKVSKLKVKSSLSVLENTLLIAKNNQLTLVNSDLELTLKVTISADVKEEGKMVINMNDLKLITKIKENYIVIEDDKITTEKKNLKIKSLDAKEYPKLVECNKSQWITSKDDILHLLETKYAIAKDKIRPVLTGVYLDKNKWVALDGYRMSIRKGCYNSDISVLIAGKQIDLLQKLINKNTKNVEFLIDKKNMYSSFKFNDVEIISKNLDGNYIKYDSIIPENENDYIKINKNEMIEELDFIENIVKNTKQKCVKLMNDFKNDVLILHCGNKNDVLDTKIKVLDHKNKNLDNDFKIAFNPQYLKESLKSCLNDEELYIVYGESKTYPIIIKKDISSYSNDNLDLVLPVRIN